MQHGYFFAHLFFLSAIQLAGNRLQLVPRPLHSYFEFSRNGRYDGNVE